MYNLPSFPLPLKPSLSLFFLSPPSLFPLPLPPPSYLPLPLSPLPFPLPIPSSPLSSALQSLLVSMLNLGDTEIDLHQLLKQTNYQPTEFNTGRLKHISLPQCPNRDARAAFETALTGVFGENYLCEIRMCIHVQCISQTYVYVINYATQSPEDSQNEGKIIKAAQMFSDINCLCFFFLSHTQ